MLMCVCVCYTLYTVQVEGEGGGGGCALFSHTSSDQYSSAEDHYLTELTTYTKKQFFQVYTCAVYVCMSII